MSKLEIKVKKYIQRYQMFENGDRVIAGISGGADSVCLFFVLLELQRELGFSFVAVHVNHGLRGAEADADQWFVEALCQKYDVPLETFRVDLESIAKKRKQSLEEAGRNIRRETFVKVLRQYGADRVALAHHQNDNAETLLWNLTRGTGLRGLSGIRPVNGQWVRPLLCLSRQEIEAYLKERNQSYCTDLTNLETTYTRNKLRHQVIPVLEEMNPAAVRHMNETMEQMCELREFVELEIKKAMDRCVTEVKSGSRDDCAVEKETRRDDKENVITEIDASADSSLKVNGMTYRISAEEWQKLSDLLKKEVIYSCLEKLSGSSHDWGRVHVDAVAGLFDRQVGKERNLSGNIRAVRTYNAVLLEKKCLNENVPCLRKDTVVVKCEDKAETMGTQSANEMGSAVFQAREIRIPGVTSVPEMNLQITARIIERDANLKVAEIPQKKYTKWFDYDIINCLYIRTRQSGDRIVIDKAGHGQKLKSWFVNEKIPADQRTQIPLLADGQEIVWVIGCRMSSAYQISEQTRQILQIEIEPMKPEGMLPVTER